MSHLVFQTRCHILYEYYAMVGRIEHAITTDVHHAFVCTVGLTAYDVSDCFFSLSIILLLYDLIIPQAMGYIC